MVDRGQIVALIILGPGKAPELGGHGFHIENLDWALVPRKTIFMPDMMERNAAHLIAIVPKWMDVAVALLAPVHELNAQFKAALRGREHFALVNVEQAIEVQERGNCRFADPDRTDHFGFDQRDRDRASGAQPRQRSRSHPARRSAAHDNDVLDRHVTPVPSMRSCCHSAASRNVNVPFCACERSQLSVSDIPTTGIIPAELGNEGGSLV